MGETERLAHDEARESRGYGHDDQAIELRQQLLQRRQPVRPGRQVQEQIVQLAPGGVGEEFAQRVGLQRAVPDVAGRTGPRPLHRCLITRQ